MVHPVRRQNYGHRIAVAVVALWLGQKDPAFAVSTRTDEYNDIPRNQTVAQKILDDEAFLDGTDSRNSPLHTTSEHYSPWEAGDSMGEEDTNMENDQVKEGMDSAKDDVLGEDSSETENADHLKEVLTFDADEKVMRHAEAPTEAEYPRSGTDELADENRVGSKASANLEVVEDGADQGSTQEKADMNRGEVSPDLTQLDDVAEDLELGLEDNGWAPDGSDLPTNLAAKDETVSVDGESIKNDSVTSEPVSNNTPESVETTSDLQPESAEERLIEDFEIERIGDEKSELTEGFARISVTDEASEAENIPEDNEAVENTIEDGESNVEAETETSPDSEAIDFSEETKKKAHRTTEEEESNALSNDTICVSDTVLEGTVQTVSGAVSNALDVDSDSPRVRERKENGNVGSGNEALQEEEAHLLQNPHVDETLIDFDQTDGEPLSRTAIDVQEISSAEDPFAASPQTQQEDDAASKDSAKPGSLAEFFQKVSDRADEGNDFHQRAAVRKITISQNDFMQRVSEQSASERVHKASRLQEDEQILTTETGLGPGEDDVDESDGDSKEYLGGEQQSSMWGIQTKDAVPARVIGEGPADLHGLGSTGTAHLSSIAKHQTVEDTATDLDSSDKDPGIEGDGDRDVRTTSHGIDDRARIVEEAALSKADPESGSPVAASDEVEAHGALPDEPTTNTVPAEKSQEANTPIAKSVNTEFVEGLDDINKFLEEVDPPDELDVGAAGSSIQEVLVGQGSQIVMKRVAMGVKHIRKNIAMLGSKTKDRFEEFATRFKDDDGKFAIAIRQDRIGEAAKRIGKLCLRGLRRCHDFLDDLLFSDDDDDLDFGEDMAKLANLREIVQQRQDAQRKANSNRSGFSKVDAQKEENTEEFVRQRLGQQS